MENNKSTDEIYCTIAHGKLTRNIFDRFTSHSVERFDVEQQLFDAMPTVNGRTQLERKPGIRLKTRNHIYMA